MWCIFLYDQKCQINNINMNYLCQHKLHVNHLVDDYLIWSVLIHSSIMLMSCQSLSFRSIWFTVVLKNLITYLLILYSSTGGKVVIAHLYYFKEYSRYRLEKSGNIVILLVSVYIYTAVPDIILWISESLNTDTAAQPAYI